MIPVAGFAGGGQYPVDCEYDAGVPVVASVRQGNSPWGPITTPNGILRIRSAGQVAVPNPAWDGMNAKTILRDHSFGSDDGTVELIDENGVSYPLNLQGGNAWGPRKISAKVPNGTPLGYYQLIVTRSDGMASPIG